MTQTAYTVGRTSSYDRALSEEPEVKKLGAYGPTEKEPDGYSGGCVWLFFNEADMFRVNKLQTEKFSVYELELPNSWAEDISTQLGEDGMYNLLHDAKIMRKIIEG